MHQELKMSLVHDLVIWVSVPPCLGISVFKTALRGPSEISTEAVSGHLYSCSPGKRSHLWQQAPLDPWGVPVRKNTWATPDLWVFQFQSWLHYFWCALTCSVSLPSLEHTQQLPDSHYNDAPAAARAALGAASVGFALFRYREAPRCFYYSGY